MPMSPTQEFLDSIKDDKVGHSPCSNECTCYHPPRTYPPWESDLHNQQLDGIHLENMKAIIARRRLAKSNVPEDHLCYKDDEDINEIRRRIANKSKETKDMEELQEGFKKQQLAFQALLMERKMSRNAGQKKS